MRVVLFFSLLLLLLLSLVSVSAANLQDERAILVDLYESLHGDEWSRIRSGAAAWLQTDVSVCDWHGVTCGGQEEEGGEGGLYVEEMFFISFFFVLRPPHT